MCLYPKLIKNRKYIANQKNGGNIPAVFDERVLMVPVGCQKCMECKKKKAREWQVRLMEEIKKSTNGKFVTLTFSNESIRELSENVKLEGYERDNEIAKIATRRFLERWRKEFGKSVRHWFVTELGHNGTENIHMHGILFTDIENEIINKIWKYGYTWISDKKKGGYVNEQTINYIVKYVNKTDDKHKNYNSRILCSQGIGKEYKIDANKYKGKETKEFYRTRTGNKIALPIYYRNKAYSDEEKEKLWIEKLDKKIRYVNGEEIDISKNEDDYYATLKYARELNKRLGYGDDEKNWNLKRYENERRNLMHKERLKVIEEIKIIRKKKIIIPKEENVRNITGNIEDAF